MKSIEVQKEEQEDLESRSDDIDLASLDYKEPPVQTPPKPKEKHVRKKEDGKADFGRQSGEDDKY